jgi:outer membrane protein assembly factor BamC
MNRPFTLPPVLTLVAAVAVVLGTAQLSGCSALGVDKALPDQRLVYKQQREVGENLEVPPDLAGSHFDDALDMPANGAATLSTYATTKAQTPATAAAANTGAVLPTVANVTLKRTADSRWLEVQSAPQPLWAKLLAFWREQGILLVEQNPAVGVMRTDWLDNRAEVRKDFVTRMMSKVIAGAYSTGTRDQYTVRIEEGLRPGVTDVHLIHRGMTEKLRDNTVANVGQTVWEPSGSDATKEAELLRRLMVFLGAAPKQAATATADAAHSTPPASPSRAKLVTEDGQQRLLIAEELRSAWRLTSTALDRAGFAVEDRDQSRGLFYVRYAGKDNAEQVAVIKPSLGSRLAFWRKDEIDPVQKYQIQVTSKATETRVSVLDASGKPDQSASGRRILQLIQAELR